MTSHLARTERDELADLFQQVGEAAPTLCEGWDTKDLLVHLLVRERSPLGASGLLIPALSKMTDKASDEIAAEPYAQLVDQLRNPPKLSFAGSAMTDKLANTLEFFVHHEDVRRAQPDWQPRRLSRSDEDQLWRAITMMSKMLARAVPVPVVLERSDNGEVHPLRKGANPVKVVGLPSEMALFLSGRRQYRGLEFSGPPTSISRLQEAKLGF